MTDTEANSESYRSREHMGHQIAHVPVVILACIALAPELMSWVSGSSIYPAVQNLMLAARAVSLGTVLTTNHTRYETEIKTYFGIPDEISTAG